MLPFDAKHKLDPKLFLLIIILLIIFTFKHLLILFPLCKKKIHYSASYRPELNYAIYIVLFLAKLIRTQYVR